MTFLIIPQTCAETCADRIDSLPLWLNARTSFLSQIQQREENFKEEEEKEG